MIETLASLNLTTTWLAFATGLFIVEACLLTTFRLFPNFWGKMINVWYDTFGLVAIMLDVLIVLIGFWITQKLYNYIYGTTIKFSLWKFIAIFLCIQIIHDFLFYLLVLKPSKPGSNAIFDLEHSAIYITWRVFNPDEKAIVYGLNHGVDVKKGGIEQFDGRTK